MFGRRKAPKQISASAYYTSVLPDLVRRATDARNLFFGSLEKYYDTPEEALDASVPAILGVECIRGQMIGHRRIATQELTARNLDYEVFRLVKQVADAVDWDWETLTNGLGMLMFQSDLNKSPEFKSRMRDKDPEALATVASARAEFQNWWATHRSDHVPPEVPDLAGFIAMAEEDFLQGTGRT